MSYGNMVSFTNGFEDSINIDFGKMSISELVGFIDRCKSNALTKDASDSSTAMEGSYWLGIAQKALGNLLSREIPQS